VLVLTRKKGERVLIGDDIVVTLIDIRGDGVRIGFDAPRGVPIQRAEVVVAVTEANTEAAATSASTAETLVGLLRGVRHPAPEPADPAATDVPAEPATPDAPAAPTAPPAPPAPPATIRGQRRPHPKPGPRPNL
jgi:carbon storage regulator